MPIYTKKGDKGETGLPGKRRLPKTELLFECLGNIDETNAVVGLVLSLKVGKTDQQLLESLEQIQVNFLSIGACLAAEDPKTASILTVLDDETAQLEKLIDQWDQSMPELKNFILPGGSQVSAILHLARTIVRRAERSLHRLDLPEELAPIARYVNRLSDFFFQAARYENYCREIPDTIWKPSLN